MKVNLENLSKLEKRLNIEVPMEIVKKSFDALYKHFQKQAEIKGFRKGKAPLDMIKSMYRDQVRSNVLQELVEEHFFKAVEHEKLRPLDQPKLKINEFDEEKPFSFTADFEIHPEIDLKKYDALSVRREKLAVDPTQIDATLIKMRESHSELVPIFEDRGAALGDVLIIDFEGFVDGAPLENAKGSQTNLELGSSQFIPGFEDGLVGSKPGQTRTLNLSFPADYHVAQLSGKPVRFEVTVKEMKKKSLPAVDAEFAKKFGFDDPQALTQAIEVDLRSNEESRIKEDFKNRLLKELVKNNPVDVPKSMLDNQKGYLVEDMRKRMREVGMTDEAFEEYKTKWDHDFTDTASFIVQSSYLVNAIAAKENLAPTPQEIEDKIEDYIQKTGMEPARVRAIYNKPEARHRLEHIMTEDKVIDFLAGKANITEVSKEELKD